MPGSLPVRGPLMNQPDGLVLAVLYGRTRPKFSENRAKSDTAAVGRAYFGSRYEVCCLSEAQEKHA